MKKFFLDKILDVGTAYKTHERVVYVIKKIGTNDTAANKLVIDNKYMGPIIQNTSPLRKTSSTIVGPLDLEGLYYVIPGDTDFKVEGTSGKIMRVIGTILMLDPGETIPSDLLARFKAQPNHYKTYLTGEYDFGAATSWADGTEVTLYTLTPKTIEKYIFNDLIFIEYTGFTVNPGDVVIQFYLNNNPIEYLYDSTVDPGIDILSFPKYDGASAQDVPFKAREFPIEVPGDNTLKITAKNVSGSAISLSSAKITLYAIAEFLRTV